MGRLSEAQASGAFVRVFDPHQVAADRNARMTRDDIEWIVIDGHMHLRDRPEWTERRTKELKVHAERARQQFNHRQRYPLSYQENGDG